MRFLIDVRSASSKGWTVSVTAEGSEASLVTRSMRRLANQQGRSAPLPPTDYAAELPPGALHRDLCTATDPQVIFNALTQLTTRQAAANGAEAFGRYLFGCLLGEAGWSAIGKAAGGKPIELSLGWTAAEAELYQFPWELMHGPTRFLCADPDREVAVTHRVAPPAAAVPAAGSNGAPTIRPRVLFVIGAALSDPEIQAGAEYIGLIHRVRAAGKALISRVLTDARPQEIRDAVESFSPSIVHFVCHGDIRNGRGQVYLMSEQSGGEEPFNVDQIVALLGGVGTRPPVVVLNACSTGGALGTQVLSAPLAAELVDAGVPVVVGHTGKITDRACRLFTRRFYEALLSGESLSAATAEGRRAGFALGGAASNGIDWAMPALFLAEGVSPVLAMTKADAVREAEQRAGYYASVTNPPSFCGRIDCSEAFSRMMYDRSVTPVRVLAYEVIERDLEVPSPRYGKTRLLRELAARAVRDGIVPCLVTFTEADSIPKNALALGKAVVRAIRETRARFGLGDVDVAEYELMKLSRRAGGDATAVLDSTVQGELDLQPATPQPNGHVVGAAVRLDLANLASQLPAPDPARGPVSSLIVLFDEVHQYGDAARELLEQMLSADGFGKPGKPIPAVLAFSGSVVAGEGSTAAQAITAFFEKGRNYAKQVPLGAFRTPIEDRLAYRQYLLALSEPFVIHHEPAKAEKVLGWLHKRVRGVPSMLERSASTDGVAATVMIAAEEGYLERANDEDALEEFRKRQAGP